MTAIKSYFWEKKKKKDVENLAFNFSQQSMF